MGWKGRAGASLALLCAACAALAQPGQAPPLSGASPGGAPAPPGGGAPAPPLLGGPAWIVAQTADLALLDKVTARTSMVAVPVGERTQFGTLTITVSRCMRRPPEEPAEAAAWITVVDSRAEAGADASFRGWMFATSPALNPLQHPVYDVRVVACR
jgi:hypothetical protein